MPAHPVSDRPDWCTCSALDMQPVAGAAPASSYVTSLQQAVDAGDTQALVAQFSSSCILTPFWEEVGFAHACLLLCYYPPSIHEYMTFVNCFQEATTTHYLLDLSARIEAVCDW